METLFLLTAYGLVILFDVLRHVRFVVTRNAEPNRLLSAIVRASAGFVITLCFTGYTLNLVTALAVYVTAYWIAFDGLFEFAMPALYRILAHPNYIEKKSVIKTLLDHYLPGARGAAFKWSILATCLIVFLLLR